MLRPVRHGVSRFTMLIFFLAGGAISYASQKLRRALISRERLLSDEKLRKSEERLRLALEGGQMGMWEWKVGSHYSRWNDKKYELLGLPIGDGHASTEIFFNNLHPDDAPVFNRALQETLESGKHFSQEFRFIRPDGEIRWLTEKARIYRDAEGKYSRMIGVTYDITERKLTEDELHARINDLAVLMDTVPAVVFIAHDPQCHLISCGKKARQLLRLPEGQKEFVLTPGQERPKTFLLMKNGRKLSLEELPLHAAAMGREVRNFELTIQLNDGTTLDLIGDAVPLYDDFGAVRGAIGAFADITELKKAQVELEKSRIELEIRVKERTEELSRTIENLQSEIVERARTMEELSEKDKLLIQQSRLAAMGEMINNIAHQWRQPLNSIALIVQELPIMYQRGEFSGEYLNEMVEKAKNNIFNMSSTIETFKTFFEPNKDKVEFRVRDAVAKTLDLLKDGFKTMHIKVKVEDVGNPVIFGYSTEFSQVLVNIFLNCRDAFLERKIDKARVITVRIFSMGNVVVVTITDNAGGIPEEVIYKIFDPYFTTKGPNKGAGIGLFMGKTIIERHMHGRLSVQNVEGGVEFRIEIDNQVASSN